MADKPTAGNPIYQQMIDRIDRLPFAVSEGMLKVEQEGESSYRVRMLVAKDGCEVAKEGTALTLALHHVMGHFTGLQDRGLQYKTMHARFMDEEAQKKYLADQAERDPLENEIAVLCWFRPELYQEERPDARKVACDIPIDIGYGMIPQAFEYLTQQLMQNAVASLDQAMISNVEWLGDSHDAQAEQSLAAIADSIGQLTQDLGKVYGVVGEEVMPDDIDWCKQARIHLGRRYLGSSLPDSETDQQAFPVSYSLQ